jgi:hypothetical protein
MMKTLVVALSHGNLYMYVKRLTTIEALQQVQEKLCNKPKKGADLDKKL